MSFSRQLGLVMEIFSAVIYSTSLMLLRLPVKILNISFSRCRELSVFFVV